MALPALSAALTVGTLAMQGVSTIKNIVTAHKTRKKMKVLQKQMAAGSAAKLAAIQQMQRGLSASGGPGAYFSGNGLNGASRQGGNFPGFV